MSSRNDVYQKFGITAEAAQLFETSLGTALLGIQGLNKGWHLSADPDEAINILNGIEKSTLGRLLSETRKYIELDDDLTENFYSALNTRNKLMHGFYERHNFKIQAEQGRKEMISNLEEMHSELFTAWQIADWMSEVILREVISQRKTTR